MAPEQIGKSFDQFQIGGLSWVERARLGGLSAVLSAGASQRKNLLLHSVGLFGAKKALFLQANKGILLDFGCGNGRMLRFFSQRGWSVIGVDITPEMLSEAQRTGLPKRSALALTDGMSVPLRDQSVDMIWVCGVLKFSLFPPGSTCRGGSGGVTDDPFIPVYHDIATEFYRVLKTDGFVVNVETYVDAPPRAFTLDFEQVGFVTKKVAVLRRYEGVLERICEWRDWRGLPPRLVILAGQLCAAFRFWFDSPRRAAIGMRDYLFIWSKPKADRLG
jgi:SAM-dependent methyltransferase